MRLPIRFYFIFAGLCACALSSVDGEGVSKSDTRFVYLSPVAYEVCREALSDYTFEPCDVPARDEPGIIWVFGDPLVMGMLKDKWEPEAEADMEAAQTA